MGLAAGVKILAFVHKYPPTHNAGAEWMLHHVLQWLTGRGHETRVVTSQPVKADRFEDVMISSQPGLRASNMWWDWADVAVTHLDVTRLAVQQSIRHRRPLVHLIHNDRQLAHHRVIPATAALAVFNSEWMRRKVAWGGHQMVLHPPVPPERYATEGPGDRILFSNATAAKGAELVYGIARANPEKLFLIVWGAYGAQIRVPADLAEANIDTAEQHPDFRTFLARAKTILIPSSYESWGRVGIEAAAAGIPAVYADTEGLLEAMGDSGIHLPVTAPYWGPVTSTPGDVKAWTEALELIDEQRPLFTSMARARAAELWAITVRQLEQLEEIMPTLRSPR